MRSAVVIAMRGAGFGIRYASEADQPRLWPPVQLINADSEPQVSQAINETDQDRLGLGLPGNRQADGSVCL